MNLPNLAWLLLFSMISSQTTSNGSIAGTVKLPDGKVVVGIRVMALAMLEGTARPDEATMVSLAETDENGRYKLENIPPGSYYLAAGPISAPTYYPGSTVASPSSVVTIRTGDNLTGHDFASAAFRRFTVKGRVIGKALGAGNSFLRLLGSTPMPVTQAKVETDGSFIFRGVQPGTYAVSLAGTFTLFGNSPSVNIDVTEDIENLEISFPSLIVGRVVTADGSPLPAVPLTTGLQPVSRCSGRGGPPRFRER